MHSGPTVCRRWAPRTADMIEAFHRHLAETPPPGRRRRRLLIEAVARRGVLFVIPPTSQPDGSIRVPAGRPEGHVGGVRAGHVPCPAWPGSDHVQSPGCAQRRTAGLGAGHTARRSAHQAARGSRPRCRLGSRVDGLIS
jgi:hypothetical protein